MISVMSWINYLNVEQPSMRVCEDEVQIPRPLKRGLVSPALIDR